MIGIEEQQRRDEEREDRERHKRRIVAAREIEAHNRRKRTVDAAEQLRDASPELLAACKLAVKVLHNPATIRVVQAAIEKAEQ